MWLAAQHQAEGIQKVDWINQKLLSNLKRKASQGTEYSAQQKINKILWQISFQKSKKVAGRITIYDWSSFEKWAGSKKIAPSSQNRKGKTAQSDLWD